MPPAPGMYEVRPSGGIDFGSDIPIGGPLLAGWPGFDYWIDGSNLAFIDLANNNVIFAGAGHDTVLLLNGGQIELSGKHNTVFGMGTITATDAPGSGHNTFDLGPAVTNFGAQIDASDRVNLFGFTDQDIANGLASAQHTPQSEQFDVRNASGASIHIALSETAGTPLPPASIFHAVG